MVKLFSVIIFSPWCCFSLLFSFPVYVVTSSKSYVLKGWQSCRRSCVQGCERTGCVDDSCFNSCNFHVNVDLEGNVLPKKSLDSPHEKFLKEPLYLRWKKWDCISECRYQCMNREEVQREANSEPPVKYHGKWPFLRIFSLQVCLVSRSVPLL